MVFRKLNNQTKLILIIQCIGMIVGTSTHVIWILQNGFLSDKYNAPFFSKIFWDSLAVLDPIAALLLVFRSKNGIILTAIIIVIDVFHNTIISIYFTSPAHYTSFEYWIANNWMLTCQIAFGLFVAITFNSNMKSVKLTDKSEE